MENQENTPMNTEKMKVDEHALLLIKKYCTIKFSIPKLYENTSFHNFNDTHADTKIIKSLELLWKIKKITDQH